MLRVGGMNTDPFLSRVDGRAQPPVVSAPSSARYFEGSLRIIPGVTVPLRSMVVQAGGDAILISPVGGDVEKHNVPPGAVLVAPSLLHHLHLKEAIEAHAPRAVWGPPGFADKLPDFAPYLKTFGQDPWPYTDLAFEVVGGAPKRNEVVFFHPPTRTIYTADLVFNLGEPEGWLAPLAFRLMGVHEKFAVPKMWSRWVDDREAFVRSIDRILRWDFDRIAPAHGQLVTHDAKPRLIAALRERELY